MSILQQKYQLFIETLKERLTLGGEELVSITKNTKDFSGGMFIRITNKGMRDCYLVWEDQSGVKFIRTFEGY